MKIYVDADACPVVSIVEKVAKEMKITVTLLCDTNHILNSTYSEIKVIGAGADAVDFALINLCHKNDVVVTQDYGVAAMALGKGALAIHQSGKLYENDNIDRMLMERHIAKKARRASSKNHMKGPKKRTPDDDERFEAAFRRLLSKRNE
ncbi:YaiI/YqxD family protein [Clostridium felsineum]|uniref:YaiI/YqxD family protein n=1 Tax=Clostridium felsineum TaxID=36839 RepID=UPI00214D5F39|nr:YaiI/YqxD family protein [Clostridium felsineum]MCR3758428.1 YaiI/YqxD family protein [Clostridium felsineum]